MSFLVNVLFPVLACAVVLFTIEAVCRLLGVFKTKCPICKEKCRERYCGGFFAIYGCLKCGTRFALDGDGKHVIGEPLRAVRRRTLDTSSASSGWSMTRPVSHSWSTAVSESLSEDGRFWSRSWRRNGERSC